MRFLLLFALGSLTLLACPAARAQAAAETALTTAATSATAGTAASKIRMPGMTLPTTATGSAARAGNVHRYTRHTGAATTMHRVPAKSARKKSQTAASHPPRVTYRRIQ